MVADTTGSPPADRQQAQRHRIKVNSSPGAWLFKVLLDPQHLPAASPPGASWPVTPRRLDPTGAPYAVRLAPDGRGVWTKTGAPKSYHSERSLSAVDGT